MTTTERRGRYNTTKLWQRAADAIKAAEFQSTDDEVDSALRSVGDVIEALMLATERAKARAAVTHHQEALEAARLTLEALTTDPTEETR